MHLIHLSLNNQIALPIQHDSKPTSQTIYRYRCFTLHQRPSPHRTFGRSVCIPADIYVRYLRAKKQDVIYICGSDEHGVPITIRAQKEGVTPQQIVDKYHAIIKQSFADFGISFDNYSRTSAPIHHQTASDFFKKMYDAGQFMEESAFQLYDEKAGQFLADRFVIGTCP
jgi:methionyl-tRNA synthetase